jgi:hypothetical protein
MRRAAFALLLALAGCSKTSAQTPREAFDRFREALAAGDGAAYYELLDADSAAFGRAAVRERRALLERGDPPAEVLEGLPLTAEELRGGDDATTTKLFYPRRSVFFQEAEWYRKAKVETQDTNLEDGDAFVDLRGEEGALRRLWFVKQADGWRFDQTRTIAEVTATPR